MSRFSFSPADSGTALVAVYPGATALLAQAGVTEDMTIAAVPPGTVLRWAISLRLDPAPQAGEDWTQAGINELIDHIIGHHHRYLFAELGRLAILLDHLAPDHLIQRFARWRAELCAHMAHEEDELFPLCRELEHPSRREGLANPEAQLHGMYQGHADAEDDLVAICEAVSELTGESALVATIQQTMADLISNLHAHVELEDSVLLPAVIFQREVQQTRRFRKTRALAALEPRAG
jgi:iron-sulfur cluster repair protein YtfE (RIC family)